MTNTKEVRKEALKALNEIVTTELQDMSKREYEQISNSLMGCITALNLNESGAMLVLTSLINTWTHRNARLADYEPVTESELIW